MEHTNYVRASIRAAIIGSVTLLSGCQFTVLDPKGYVGDEIKELIITALLLMLIVVIPVILMTIYFAYKYRASNQGEEYLPEWSHSNKIEAAVWAVPIVIIAILGTITWKSTHALEPSRPLDNKTKAMTIEVVALDWKWLFIYPDQNIATINHVVIPKDVPIEFKITSNTVMNSFFIPALGSQIYAMPGMTTKLNLIANHTGDFKGISASYSGKGFSKMKFTATAVADKQAFSQWVNSVKESPKNLDSWNRYCALAQPTEDVPVSYYSHVMDGLFKAAIMQHPGAMMSDSKDMHSFKPCLVQLNN
ncbi:ubiquinol oxidase subunit II [Vibrio sp. SS-MA-C1-2]|uniref:ubiquinol oxidase subunit II n=1 Tax=Vibrio sp. SS-MA-C1-2 TaxID=2908646 RepID=UPI001F1A916A|nr:ubiquinol oxidase subunit II [Vibrio sp. SS-MA-C1-2]UJF17550.1 ubiquinol oxidase subunit II [Vibrio sp. SS-MA-C1-2]